MIMNKNGSEILCSFVARYNFGVSSSRPMNNQGLETSDNTESFEKKKIYIYYKRYTKLSLSAFLFTGPIALLPSPPPLNEMRLSTG